MLLIKKRSISKYKNGRLSKWTRQGYDAKHQSITYEVHIKLGEVEEISE